MWSVDAGEGQTGLLAGSAGSKVTLRIDVLPNKRQESLPSHQRLRLSGNVGRKGIYEAMEESWI